MLLLKVAPLPNHFNLENPGKEMGAFLFYKSYKNEPQASLWLHFWSEVERASGYVRNKSLAIAFLINL